MEGFGERKGKGNAAASEPFECFLTTPPSPLFFLMPCMVRSAEGGVFGG